jgi:hypothetical protein
VQNVTGIFIGIALNMWIAFGSLGIFPMLLLPIQKRWKVFPSSDVYFDFSL